MSPSAPFRRILVPTDFSVPAERAWSLAQCLARAADSELVLVHVVPGSWLPIARAGDASEAVRKWAAEELEDCAGKALAQGLRVRVALRTGVAYREIVALAREDGADLIVVATLGRGGIGRALLGSVADRVMRLAPCPVLTVPEPAAGEALSRRGGSGKVSTTAIPRPRSDRTAIAPW
jgi:nucleotide-binding universal stress UspA family protein